MKYMNMNSIFACVIIWIYYVTYHVLFYKKFLKRFFLVQFGTIDNIWTKELQSILRLIVFFHKYLQIIVSFSIGSKLKVLIDNEKQLKWKGFDFFSVIITFTLSQFYCIIFSKIVNANTFIFF